MVNKPAVSVILPTLNERQHIASCLGSIQAVLSGWSPEVIVVDHGSTDGTREIAQLQGARVLQGQGATIAGLRNQGAAAAAGDVLVFIDADVILRPGWAGGFRTALEQLERVPETLAGYSYGLGDPPSHIEKLWFDPSRRRTTYIPSGNMIVPRPLFVRLGGFDVALATGEDVDLCERIVSAGGRILAIEELDVEHRGFPTTLRSFVRKEAWHGVGDYQSLATFRASRVAQATALFVGLHAALLVWPLGALIAISFLCALCAVAKYGWRGGAGDVLQLSGLFYAYFAGRAAAMIATILRGRPGAAPHTRRHQTGATPA